MNEEIGTELVGTPGAARTLLDRGTILATATATQTTTNCYTSISPEKSEPTSKLFYFHIQKCADGKILNTYIYIYILILIHVPCIFIIL